MKRIVLLLSFLFLFAASSTKAQAAQPQFFYVVTAVTSSGFESIFSNQVTATFGQGQHIVTLGWTASTSTVAGYNVYRSTVSAGPYVKINAAPVTGVTYTDTFVLPNAPSGLAATIS